MRLANKLTVLRILLVPFFLTCVIYYQPRKDYLRLIALGIFCLAVLTDFVDGIIARAKKEKTKLGSVLDPLADKILLITAFIALSRAQFHILLPPWVVVTVISRDIIIILGATIIQHITGHLDVIPSRLGKITTFCQMVTIISVLLNFSLSFIIWDMTIIFTVLSGLGYIYSGNKLLSENKCTHSG